jgi:hypothetical protein
VPLTNMPSDFWEDAAEDGEFAWDDVESIRAVRGDDGWDVYVDVDGEMVSVVEGLDNEEMQEEFWDELYFWAMDNDVDFDRVLEYSPE